MEEIWGITVTTRNDTFLLRTMFMVDSNFLFSTRGKMPVLEVAVVGGISFPPPLNPVVEREADRCGNDIPP